MTEANQIMYRFFGLSWSMRSWLVGHVGYLQYFCGLYAFGPIVVDRNNEKLSIRIFG